MRSVGQRPGFEPREKSTRGVEQQLQDRALAQRFAQPPLFATSTLHQLAERVPAGTHIHLAHRPFVLLMGVEDVSNSP